MLFGTQRTMESSTTVVNMKEEAVDKLVEVISQLVETELSKPTSMTDFVGLMEEHTDAIIAGSEGFSDEDAEGCFQIVLLGLQSEASANVTKELSLRLSKALSDPQYAEVKPELRLKIMANLFNVLCDDEMKAEGDVKVQVLADIIRYAGATQQLNALHG